ncbi:unnamed protein product [Musa acuminata subsp. burmannicoides]
MLPRSPPQGGAGATAAAGLFCRRLCDAHRREILPCLFPCRQRGGGAEPVREVPQEGGADGVPVPVRGHLLRRPPVRRATRLHVRLQGGRPRGHRPRQPRREGRQAPQDLKNLHPPSPPSPGSMDGPDLVPEETPLPCDMMMIDGFLKRLWAFPAKSLRAVSHVVVTSRLFPLMPLSESHPHHHVTHSQISSRPPARPPPSLSLLACLHSHMHDSCACHHECVCQPATERERERERERDVPPMPILHPI